VAEGNVIGVIGTSCSGAATGASPLITGAGMVLISPSNTSPALTSDLAGTAGEAYNVGYYRTAHNDLFQGKAVADFVLNELGFTTAAAIHDGDPYTQGLSQAFADAFIEGGGTITTFTAVNKGDTDMVPVLTEVAAGDPQALYYPIFMPEGGFIAQQAGDVTGMEDVTMIAADGLLTTNFLVLPETEGTYLSGPDLRFGENASVTGVNATDFLARYEAAYGEAPSAAFWAHSYDATVMLLTAIDAASVVEDGTLFVDLQGVRDALDAMSGFAGITGSLTCDDFGDCGSQRVSIVFHEDADNPEAAQENVVYSFAP
jgi:branched-chain amino acid transport system substrate-binding protein